MSNGPDPDRITQNAAKGESAFLESLHGGSNPSGLPETPATRMSRLAQEEAAQNPPAVRDPNPWEIPAVEPRYPNPTAKTE